MDREGVCIFEGNRAKLGSDIFTFADRMIIIPNVTDLSDVENIVKNETLFRKFILTNSRKIELPTKSGFTFNLGVIFVDHQDNIVSNKNDEIIQIDLTNKINYNSINISKSIAKLNKGIAILERISLITKSQKVINLVIERFSLLIP